MLIGYVGLDPEVRYLDQGVCTARLRLATTTPGYRLTNGTEVPERTEWHTIWLWGKIAEVAEKYVHRGDKIYVEGELRYRTYADRHHTMHSTVEVAANKLELLSPRTQIEEQAPAEQGALANDAAPKTEAPDVLPF